jgi:hypothetical protein
MCLTPVGNIMVQFGGGRGWGGGVGSSLKAVGNVEDSIANGSFADRIFGIQTQEVVHDPPRKCEIFPSSQVDDPLLAD